MGTLQLAASLGAGSRLRIPTAGSLHLTAASRYQPEAGADLDVELLIVHPGLPPSPPPFLTPSNLIRAAMPSTILLEASLSSQLSFAAAHWDQCKKAMRTRSARSQCLLLPITSALLSGIFIAVHFRAPSSPLTFIAS